MRKVTFSLKAFEQYQEWQLLDKKITQKINALILETIRNPFEGSGKPEALKHELQGYWSRRINLEHRLVYKVTDDAIIIIACKYHY
ncbi:MAG: Txe/YoeB family addiction module toxin [Bacteroidota bacterium]|jgi:toxin YoeB|nr:MAG: Txe/YoeB family addiction module toxin [Bacteroidota bacterium]